MLSAVSGQVEHLMYRDAAGGIDIQDACPHDLHLGLSEGGVQGDNLG